MGLPCENVSAGVCGQRRPRSACATSPQTELLNTMECFNDEQMPERDLVHAWDESESVHFAHARRHISAWRGPYVINELDARAG